MEMCKKPINGEDYAPITRALRGRLKVAALGLAKPMVDGLLAECDNIDALHKALDDEYAEMRTFVESLDDAAKKHEDVDLWGTRYIAGPVDSQGVPINFETPIERWGALELIIYNMHDKCWYVTGHDMTAPTLSAEECTVVLPPKPTVEDVLREFTRTILNQKAEYREQNIAKYAAKLRLADDANE